MQPPRAHCVSKPQHVRSLCFRRGVQRAAQWLCHRAASTRVTGSSCRPPEPTQRIKRLFADRPQDACHVEDRTEFWMRPH